MRLLWLCVLFLTNTRTITRSVIATTIPPIVIELMMTCPMAAAAVVSTTEFGTVSGIIMA